MVTSYVVHRVGRDGAGSVRISSRWHPMSGRVVSIAPLLLVFLYTLAYPPQVPMMMRWLFASPFLLLVAGDLYFYRQQRVVIVDPTAKQVVIRDRTRIPFSPVVESRIAFDGIRGVGTVRMTESDPQSSHRLVTLHLEHQDRYLITVPGRWEHRDFEDGLRAALDGPRPAPAEDAESAA